jgi:hypothetical protein
MTALGIERQSISKSPLLHFTAAGALIFGISFIVCWLLAFVPVSATHAFIALFTAADTTSQAALAQGLCWSLAFGAWLGFLTAVIHKFLNRVGI